MWLFYRYKSYQADFSFSSSVENSKQNDENVERNIAYVVPQLTSLNTLQPIERNHLQEKDMQRLTDLIVKEEIAHGRDPEDLSLKSTVKVY